MQGPSPSLCQIFIYTTAKKDYANKAGFPRLCLSARHCLSQQDCVCSQGCYWKDLTQLGRDLGSAAPGGIHVPRSPGAVRDPTLSLSPPQAANWIQVPPWSGDPEDEELLHLIPVLDPRGTEWLGVQPHQDRLFKA
uniref:Uncharacterized protein n=1 Tax=Geospiza parvula TaxID=87175 RepID=A0A8C3NST3_GEOPR